MTTSYAQAEASNLSKAQVYAIAEAFSKQLDYRPGGNLVDAIARIGGRVSVEDTLLEDPTRSGSLLVDAPDDFKIILPAHTPPNRDRFTLAHELGHYVLHYLWTDRRNERLMALRRGSDRIEWEANWFAAAFLMPEADFCDQFKTLDGNLTSLAQYFCVSEQAAQIRAKGLGLING